MTIRIATIGDLTGFPILSLDTARMMEFHRGCEARGVSYKMGAKDPHPGHWPIDFHEIDCSGYVRTLLAYATGGQTLAEGMPDGSYCEDGWFLDKRLKFHPIKSAAEYLSLAGIPDTHPRAFIHHPNGRGGDSTGHIWLCYKRFSLESYGGHGVGSRSFDHPWFQDHADDCFVLC